MLLSCLRVVSSALGLYGHIKFCERPSSWGFVCLFLMTLISRALSTWSRHDKWTSLIYGNGNRNLVKCFRDCVTLNHFISTLSFFIYKVIFNLMKNYFHAHLHAQIYTYMHIYTCKHVCTHPTLRIAFSPLKTQFIFFFPLEFSQPFQIEAIFFYMLIFLARPDIFLFFFPVPFLPPLPSFLLLASLPSKWYHCCFNSPFMPIEVPFFCIIS